jgi:programmed cell death 6-interacting protein
MFRHDLEVIDNLRRDAVNVREAHPSGIKKLQTYAGQLVWIGGKFPIDVKMLSPMTLDTEDDG